MTPSQNKLLYLESLRGLAALSVVFFHLRETFFPSDVDDFAALTQAHASGQSWANLFLSISCNGAFAVRLFFLLSGFVLSISYFRSKKPAVLTSAALRRYPRLMIPAFASVMFGWIIQRFHGFRNTEAAALMPEPTSPWMAGLYRHDLSFFSALKQGLFGTFFHFDWDSTLNLALWTMSIELAGSFFVFSFLALVGSAHRRPIIYLVMFVVLQRTENYYLLDFLCGMALCDFFVHRENARPKIALPLGTLALMATLGFVLGGFFQVLIVENAFFKLHGLNLPTLASLLIVGGVVFSAPLQAVLEHRVISFFGKLSFPIYLFHHAIIQSLGCGFYLYLRGNSFSHLDAALVSSLLCLAVIVPVAWGAYYAVELPSIRAGSLLAGYFRLPPPAGLPVDHHPITN